MFMAPMIRALLNTKEDVWPPVPIDPKLPFKAQTRRPGKIQRKDFTELGVSSIGHQTKGIIQQATYRAFPGRGTARWAICECEHSIGTLIYAKETYTFGRGTRDDSVALAPHMVQRGGSRKPVLYRANQYHNDADHKWKSSMFMRKEYARLWFEVVDVRVERVSEITDEDARLEGVAGVFYHKEGGVIEPHTEGAYRKDYERLW